MFRIRQTEEEQKASLATKCCFGFIYVIAQIFLHAPVALILFWIIQYKALNNKPFAWRGSALDDPQTDPPEEDAPIYATSRVLRKGQEAPVGVIGWNRGNSPANAEVAYQPNLRR